MQKFGLQGKWPSHIFSTTKANGRFVPFNLGYFLDLTVFTLLSHKGKKSVIFPPCLHSIINTCNISASSFTYNCIKAELVKQWSHLILASDSMWAEAAVIMWYWTFLVFTQPPRWQHRFFSRIVYVLMDTTNFRIKNTVLSTTVKEI